jgi:hypothetical protein
MPQTIVDGGAPRRSRGPEGVAWRMDQRDPCEIHGAGMARDPNGRQVAVDLARSGLSPKLSTSQRGDAFSLVKAPGARRRAGDPTHGGIVANAAKPRVLIRSSARARAPRARRAADRTPKSWDGVDRSDRAAPRPKRRGDRRRARGVARLRGEPVIGRDARCSPRNSSAPLEPRASRARGSAPASSTWDIAPSSVRCARREG